MKIVNLIKRPHINVDLDFFQCHIDNFNHMKFYLPRTFGTFSIFVSHGRGKYLRWIWIDQAFVGRDGIVRIIDDYVREKL